MKLTILTTLVAIASALVMLLGLSGCDGFKGTPPAPQVAAPAAAAPRALTGYVYCLDGWEVILTPNGPMYRHQHDVQEHLISCLNPGG